MSFRKLYQSIRKMITINTIIIKEALLHPLENSNIHIVDDIDFKITVTRSVPNKL